MLFFFPLLVVIAFFLKFSLSLGFEALLLVVVTGGELQTPFSFYFELPTRGLVFLPLGMLFVGDGEFGTSHPSFFLFLFCCFVFCKCLGNSFFFPVPYVYRRLYLPTFHFFHFFEMFLLTRDKEVRIHHSFLFPFLGCCFYLQRSGELEAHYFFFFVVVVASKEEGVGGVWNSPNLLLLLFS